jgi:hypothetical protein
MPTRERSLQTPCGSSSSLLGIALKMSTGPSRSEEASRLPGEIVPPRPEPAGPVTRARHHRSKLAKARWPPRYPGCAEALNMLTLRPVFATPVPRHHVAPKAPDGSRLVYDRATNERFVVYLPRFVNQFRVGHHAGLWYVRRLTDVGATPRSGGFPTARAAVEALRAGLWRPLRSSPYRDRPPKPCRIIWS